MNPYRFFFVALAASVARSRRRAIARQGGLWSKNDILNLLEAIRSEAETGFPPSRANMPRLLAMIKRGRVHVPRQARNAHRLWKVIRCLRRVFRKTTQLPDDRAGINCYNLCNRIWGTDHPPAAAAAAAAAPVDDEEEEEEEEEVTAGGDVEPAGIPHLTTALSHHWNLNNYPPLYLNPALQHMARNIEAKELDLKLKNIDCEDTAAIQHKTAELIQDVHLLFHAGGRRDQSA